MLLFLYFFRLEWFYTRMEVKSPPWSLMHLARTNWIGSPRVILFFRLGMTSKPRQAYSILTSLVRPIDIFEISGPYVGCSGDTGWLVVTDGSTCQWEAHDVKPNIQYSTKAYRVDMNSHGEIISNWTLLYLTDHLYFQKQGNLWVTVVMN